MKKRLLTLLSGSFFVAACSSAPKEETQAPPAPAPWDRDASPSQAVPSPAKAAADDVRKTAPSEAPSRNNSDDPWSGLNSAIKTQSEDQIRSEAQKILARVPTDERALNAMALVAYRKGQFDYAIYLFDKAIQAHPNKGELYSNVGLVQLAQNNRLEAVKSFRKAVELAPDDGVASANLGSIYVAEKDYNKAAVVLETSYKKGPRDVKTMNNYAVALAATGKGDKAKAIYEEALKDGSNNREVLLNYAILLIDDLDQPKEGLEIVNRLKFLGAPSESRERLSALENKAKAGVK